jgi:uncharacterized protein
VNYERKPILSGQTPFAMLVFSSLGVILTGLLFQLVGIFTATLIYGISLPELLQAGDLADQGLINALKLVQIIGAMGTFIFSSLLLSFFYTGDWLGYFSFGHSTGSKSVVLVILIMVAALPFVNFLTDINQRIEIPFSGVEQYLRQLEEQTEKLMMTLIRADHIGALLVNLFMIALIPAVGEELVFRGLVQRHLTEWFRNAHVAIIVASAIFSLVHFQVYSFLPRFFLGLLLGYTYYYGKSIWYPIIAHLVNNTVGVLFYYFYMKELTGDSLEEIGTLEMMPAVALMSFLAVAAMMAVWIKMVRSDLKGFL